MNLNEEISKTGYTIVKFYATWCGPCRMMNPILDKVAQRDDVKLIAIDIEQFPDLTAEYGIASVPALIFCKDGVICNTEVGTMNEQMINNHLDSL